MSACAATLPFKIERWAISATERRIVGRDALFEWGRSMSSSRTIASGGAPHGGTGTQAKRSTRATLVTAGLINDPPTRTSILKGRAENQPPVGMNSVRRGSIPYTSAMLRAADRAIEALPRHDDDRHDMNRARAIPSMSSRRSPLDIVIRALVGITLFRRPLPCDAVRDGIPPALALARVKPKSSSTSISIRAAARTRPRRKPRRYLRAAAAALTEGFLLSVRSMATSSTCRHHGTWQRPLAGREGQLFYGAPMGNL